MRVHAVRLGPRPGVSGIPLDRSLRGAAGWACSLREKRFGADSDPSYDRHKFEHGL